MDLHDQLELQTAQETQITKELETFLDRLADEYAITKYQLASMLEEQKLRVLGFWQPSDEAFALLDKLRNMYGD